MIAELTDIVRYVATGVNNTGGQKIEGNQQYKEKTLDEGKLSYELKQTYGAQTTGENLKNIEANIFYMEHKVEKLGKFSLYEISAIIGVKMMIEWPAPVKSYFIDCPKYVIVPNG